MGHHSKPSRIRLSQAVPAAAAPTLASVAAAVFLAPQAQAAASATADTPAPARPAVQDSALLPGLAGTARMSSAQLASALRQELLVAMHQGWHGQLAPAVTAAPARSRAYTVRAGDSLASIAAQVYHNQAAWPVLYWGNRGEIRWADQILPGQELKVPALPATIPAPPSLLAPPARPVPPARTVADFIPRHASTAPVRAQSAPVPEREPGPAASSSGGPYPGGAFGECVVSRESGGNPQVMNASGHYGLYQFSASTWAEYGGNPADFGHASAAEQEQVFANALARGGEFNWAPYDGC